MTTPPTGSDPATTKAHVAAIFDQIAPSYDQTGADFFSTFGRMLVERADLRPGWRVLDVGCGRGAVLRPAAAAVRPGGRVLGIDLAPTMVAELAREIAETAPNAHLVVADAEHPPAAGPFDAVVSGLCLHFLPDLDAALRSYAEVLAPGGRLAFSSFAADDPRWAPIHGIAIDYGANPATRFRAQAHVFSADDSITAALAAAGFVDVTHEPVPHDTPFASYDDWWAWTWATGARELWRSVPEERLPEAKTTVWGALASLVEGDGRLHVRMTVRYTIARKP